MLYPRDEPSLTLLDDGRVLIIGGYKASNQAELWDPRSGVFRSAGRIWHARWGHAAVLLSDGRVLVVGGDAARRRSWRPSSSRTAEIWDPTTHDLQHAAHRPPGPGSRAGPSSSPTVGSSISGGFNQAGTDPVPSEYWDPTTGVFAPADELAGSARPAGSSSTTDGCWSSTDRVPVSGTPRPGPRSLPDCSTNRAPLVPRKLCWRTGGYWWSAAKARVPPARCRPRSSGTRRPRHSA